MSLRHVLLITLALGVLSGSLGFYDLLEAQGTTRTATAAEALVEGSRDPLGEYAPILMPNRPRTGFLGFGDDRIHSNGDHFDVFTYQGAADEHLLIKAHCPTFDIGLEIYWLVDGEWRLLALSPEETHPENRLELNLPDRPAAYRIAITAKAGFIGTYTITAVSEGSITDFDWSTKYPGGGDPSERYALLVGISDYPGLIYDLDRGPINDVLFMKNLLVEQFGFLPKNVETLQDVEGNREQLEQAFRRHLGQAGPGGVAVFYYSGHGIQLTENRGRRDLEPDSRDEALALWGTTLKPGTGAPLYGYLLDDELGALIGSLRAGRVLIALDACHSGTATRVVPGQIPASDPTELPEGMVRAEAWDPAPKEKSLDWEQIETEMEVPQTHINGVEADAPAPDETEVTGVDLSLEPGNHILLSAAASDEVAFNWSVKSTNEIWFPVGLFTLHLRRALTNLGPNDSFSTLMDAVRPRVRMEALRVMGQAQTVQLEGARKSESIREFLRKR